MSEKLKRPKAKTQYERWEEMVGKDCVIKPPSITSWIIVGILFIVFTILFLICIFIVR